MRLLLLLVCAGGVSLFGGCATGPVPQTVGHVDLGRYAGRWYEVARVPQWFEMGCTATTATYTALPDGRVGVLNECHEGDPLGKVRRVEGTARVVDAATNAKLKVSFGGPFEGDYWVLRLNEGYTTAAVGSPDRGSLWILHREPAMAAAEYEALVASLKADGFPVERLRATRHMTGPGDGGK